jgi:hypothetical protein
VRRTPIRISDEHTEEVASGKVDMSNLQAQRVMAISGLLVGLGVMLTIPLYFGFSR